MWRRKEFAGEKTMDCPGCNEEAIESNYICETKDYVVRTLSGDLIKIIYEDHDIPEDDPEIGDTTHGFYCLECDLFIEQSL